MAYAVEGKKDCRKLGMHSEKGFELDTPAGLDWRLARKDGKEATLEEGRQASTRKKWMNTEEEGI